MDRARRALACLAVVAGLTVVQAAPAFADGSAVAGAGDTASVDAGSSGASTGGASTSGASTSTGQTTVPDDQPATAPGGTHDPAPGSSGSDAPTSKTPASKTPAPKAPATSTTPAPKDGGHGQVVSRSTKLTPLADPPSPLTVTLTAAPVDVNGDRRQGAGDALDLTATVRASGPSDVSSLVVAPAGTGVTTGTAFSCPVTTVATGAEVTCTSRHELTQADVDAGHVTVVVTASGTVVATSTSTTSAPTTLTTPVTGVGSLALTQRITQRSDADRDGRLDAGDLVDVRLTVRNTGTLTLSRLAISDSLLKRLHVSLTCSATGLVPGASTTCRSARFAVTRAQATAKRLRNQATALARTPSGVTVKSATSTASVAVQAPPSTRPSRPSSPRPSAVARLRVSQWVASVNDHDGNGRLDVGDTITFGFRATNTGTTTVYGLRVVDRRLDRAGVGVHCPASTLAPGASVVCMSGPVTVVPWQAKKGFGRNFAYATAHTAAGTSVRSNSSVTDVGQATASVQAAALPRTGSDLADPALLGLVLLLGGATMTVGSRRLVRRPA